MTQECKSLINAGNILYGYFRRQVPLPQDTLETKALHYLLLHCHGQCKDCKKWDISSSTRSSYRRCSQPVSDDIQEELERPQGIYYQDYEGWDAFWTGPDFGCVNFEAKPPEEKIK